MVQHRVASSDIEIGETVDFPAHLLAHLHYLPCLLQRHLLDVGMSLGIDIAMLTALVAAVGDMPLESEILHV